VTEQPLPDFQIALQAIAGIFKPRRKLRPRRKARKPAKTVPDSCEIQVQVVRGFNVPTRKLGGGVVAPNSGMADDGYVNAFVEVTFGDSRHRTHVCEGANPVWNEALTLDFIPPNNDFSTKNLLAIRDEVCFNVFDEVIMSLPKDDRSEMVVHERRERRWLGSFSVPFGSLYENSRVEGVFRVDTPTTLLGYHPAGTGSTVDMSVAQHARLVAGKDIAPKTMLSVYLTLEPPLPPPQPIIDRPTSAEDASFEKPLAAFNKTWKGHPHAKGRCIQATAMDLSGRMVFVPRFITPLEPPPGLDSVHKVFRFVSMIPTIEDAVTFGADIWSTSEQFLELLAGDEDEHAVLLTNYFVYLQKECWLVIGKANPEGKTAYVLTRDDDGNFLLWDATSGDCYSTSDFNCPLKDIGCVVTGENVWANLQRFGDPARMHFGFHDNKAWRPFYGPKDNPPPIKTVQAATIEYSPPNEDYARRIQRKIETEVVQKFQTWRRRFVTKWNRPCGRKLRDLLPRFEEEKQGGMRVTDDDHVAILGDTAVAYHITGFPLDMPWTTVEPVIEAVRNTRMHTTEDPSAEFAFAAYVHPYPNRVCAVWVYIAALFPAR
jgi:coiled-coil and C2 domain-containing protein 2A